MDKHFLKDSGQPDCCTLTQITFLQPDWSNGYLLLCCSQNKATATLAADELFLQKQEEEDYLVFALMDCTM